MAITAVTEGWERCRPRIEPGAQRGRGDAPEESREADAAAAASPESGAAAARGAGARGAVLSAPRRCARAQGQVEAHRLRSRSGSRGRLRRGLLSLLGAEGMRIERRGLCKRQGHAATCEPPATAGGGSGISGPRQEETLGGPRPPTAGRTHTRTRAHPHSQLAAATSAMLTSRSGKFPAGLGRGPPCSQVSASRTRRASPGSSAG